MSATTNVARARALGAELRAARKRAGVTQEQLANKLRRVHSDVSRWERGKRLPSETDTATILAILGVTGDERDRLLQLARDAADPNWIAPGINKQLAALIEDEKTARRIISVQPLIVPGLLQTGDYARSIMSSAGATAGQVEQRVLMRMGRQRVLSRRNPPDFVAIIGEYALRYPPCSKIVMAEQLHHLIAMGRRDNVTIMVLPFDIGYSPAIEGPFVLLEFGQGEAVVQQEHYRSTTAVTDDRDVRDYQAAVDDIRRKVMSVDDSLALILEYINRMERNK